MMTTLKNYCLKIMGITQWKHRDSKDYLVLIDINAQAEHQTLLERMIQALKWPLESTQTLSLMGEASAIKETFLQQIKNSRPQKILILGCDEHALGVEALHSIPHASVPSLSLLLTDKEAKKRAWQLMQL